MTALLEQAIDRARALPKEVQDDVARVVLQLSGLEAPAYLLSAEDAATFALSLAQAAAGSFASDDAVEAIWSKDR